MFSFSFLELGLLLLALSSGALSGLPTLLGFGQ